ncbi:hypothetical protein DID77_01395 [Candidatus Marinamargulisbacteria bacterium SCGC AG-439-L15]|nr:hypothetical protein DID77_01395 [Candidatus Marinamargulisbacteria bacterium SCGC AG-439-L15]
MKKDKKFVRGEGSFMRQYTLYKAAQKSKISRYKLEQAIKDGLLKTTSGKGTIKYYISEDELNGFIEKYGDHYIQQRVLDERDNPYNDSSQFIAREIHEQLLYEKERIIKLLEGQSHALQQNNKPETILMEYENILESTIKLIPKEREDEKKDLLNRLQKAKK